MNSSTPILLAIAGIAACLLGAAHFFFPVLFDFEGAIPENGPPLKPFRLLFFSHNTARTDVLGIAWVMNHCVSYVLVTVGFFDIFSKYWIAQPYGKGIAVWIAVWWGLRGFSQFYLGRRRADWIVFSACLFLGLLHFAILFV